MSDNPKWCAKCEAPTDHFTPEHEEVQHVSKPGVSATFKAPSVSEILRARNGKVNLTPTVEALHALVLETVLEAVGEDEEVRGKYDYLRNQLRQELRTNLQEAIDKLFKETE